MSIRRGEERLRELVATRAEGNPLFVEELLRMIEDVGDRSEITSGF